MRRCSTATWNFLKIENKKTPSIYDGVSPKTNVCALGLRRQLYLSTAAAPGPCFPSVVAAAKLMLFAPFTLVLWRPALLILFALRRCWIGILYFITVVFLALTMCPSHTLLHTVCKSLYEKAPFSKGAFLLASYRSSIIFQLTYTKINIKYIQIKHPHIMLIDILLIGGACLAIVCFIIAIILGVKQDRNPHLMVDEGIRKWRIALSILTLLGVIAHTFTLLRTENKLHDYETIIIIAAVVIAFISCRWLKILLSDNS